MGNLSRIGVSIDSELLHRCDSFIAENGYENRSEAFRDLIRDRLVGSVVVAGSALVVIFVLEIGKLFRQQTSVMIINKGDSSFLFFGYEAAASPPYRHADVKRSNLAHDALLARGLIYVFALVHAEIASDGGLSSGIFSRKVDCFRSGQKF